MKNKSILCCVLTDPHSKEDNYEFVEGIYEQFISLCKKLKCYRAVNCGDFFQERFPGGPLNTELSVKKCLKKFDENNIILTAIPGNHDKTNYTSHLSYLDVIEYGSDFVRIESLPAFENIKTSNDIRFAFLPYFLEGDCYNNYLKKLISSIKIDNKIKYRRTILFTHIGINGALNNDAANVENGVEKESFDFFDLVIVGHYHNRNALTKKIHYIGNTHQQNFGEDENKGFAIIYDDLSIEYVQSIFPKFIKIDIRVENKEEIRKNLQKYKDSQDNVRFVFKGSKEQLESLDKTEFEKVGIDIKTKNDVELGIAFENIEDAEIVVHDKKTLIKNWLAYSKTVGLTSEQRNKGMKSLNQLS